MIPLADRLPGTGLRQWAWAVAMATATTVVAFVLLATLVTSDAGARFGLDFRLYLDATRSWMAGEGFYFPWQFAQPYGMDPAPILYPPPILLLLIPFTILPAFLWWAVPLSVVVWAVWRHHPARWSWPLLVLLFGWASGPWLVWAGNPMMWAAAAVAYATVRGWSGPLVLLKPSLAPFALVGIRTRGWWVTLAIVGVVSFAFLPMWAEYLTILRNFDSGRGLGYSFPDYPMLAGIVLAWAAGRA